MCPSSPTSTRPASSNVVIRAVPGAGGRRQGDGGAPADVRSGPEEVIADDGGSVLAAMPEVIDQVALARLYGEPLFALPNDLYIPPEALQVFLEAFEGPLDLLLYLIRKQNFNILDIPMAGLTRQYLSYVDEIRQTNLELAAEYLLMAALLIEIKSRMLLPRPPVESEAETDPRAELVRRLLEYEQMKKAGRKLDELPHLGRDYSVVCVWVEKEAVQRLPDVDPEDLRTAWLGMIARAKAARHHKVTREQLSVRERMSAILRRLQGHGFLEFTQLFNPLRGVADLVVTFLAILELARESLIQVTQHGSFAPIYLRAQDGSAD